MSMLLALISVIGLSIGALAIRHFSRANFCPLCVGVSLTWFILLLARWQGYQVDSLVLGILLGGSVVGIESLLAKRLPQPNPVGKIIFVSAGWWSVYNLIISDWLMFGIGLGLWFIVSYAMYRAAFRLEPKSAELKKQLDDCC